MTTKDKTKRKPQKRRRDKGEGGITKRADGRWQGTVKLPNRKTRYVYARSKEALLPKLYAARTEAANDPQLIPAKHTVESWVTDYLENETGDLAESTRYQYESSFRLHIKPAIGKIRLADVTELGLREFFRGLTKSQAKQTRNILSGAFEHAKDMRLIERNPCAGNRLTRGDQKEIDVWTEAEVQTFIEAVKADNYAAAFLLGICCGLRINEITALRWENVELDESRLHVRLTAKTSANGRQFGSPKTKSSRRTVPLPEIVSDALRDRWAVLMRKGHAGSPWVFPSSWERTDNPVWDYVLRKRFKKITTESKLPPIRFHDLRHTFATLMEENGITVKVVSVVMGHGSTATTSDIYQHPHEHQSRQVADVIDRLFSPAGVA